MLELKNINKYYNAGTVNEMCLFEDFNLTIHDGQFVSVVGSNGSGKTSLAFEEGVDSYVTYAGPLKDNVAKSLYKVKSTMCNCGVVSIPELQEKARLTLVSSTSIVEGGYHDVVLKTHGASAQNG